LAIIMMGRLRHRMLRLFIIATILGAVILTTQKGAFVAFVPIAAILCLPARYRLRLTRQLCLAFMAAAVVLPLLTYGLHMSHGTGVFSTESIYLRLAYTWPQALQ
jgi:hypothetical protein